MTSAESFRPGSAFPAFETIGLQGPVTKPNPIPDQTGSSPNQRGPRPIVRASALPYLLVTVGAALRLGQYLVDRSYWIDESFLALNVFGRTLAQLARPLDHNQAAPFLFLAIQRLMYLIAGGSELTMRAFPLVCGVFSLLLFYVVAQKCLSRPAVAVAVGLFAFSDALIYYSSEAKQYSADVAATLVCYLLYARATRSPLTVRRGLLTGLLGGITIGFSYPAVFVLCGISFALSLHAAGERRTGGEWKGVPTAIACWASCFALFYGLTVRDTGRNPFLRSYWNHAFMPFPPSSLNDVNWLYWAVRDPVQQTVGPFDSPIPLVAFLVGCLVMARRSKDWFLALLIPELAALGASALHLYPFQGRMLLFLVPSASLVVAQGVAAVAGASGSKVIGSLLAAIVLVFPALDALYYLAHPRHRSELRPVVAYVLKRWQPGDTLLISWYAQFPYQCYQKTMPGLPSEYLVLPRLEGDGQEFHDSIERARGKPRVWILWGGVVDWRSETPIEAYKIEFSALRQALNRLGRCVAFSEHRSAYVMLYDCR